ncbi:MAG: ATP-binding cassette domain-containing protein, partial [Acetobacteraceae bacterium]|nr:ATP-binding cassette domain-containing protein [Acetobacteraceae bacterium]
MSLLEVRGVTKAFGSLVAVDSVSLAVDSGELRAIIGPNGAGKTTFFNLITGFFP